MNLNPDMLKQFLGNEHSPFLLAKVQKNIAIANIHEQGTLNFKSFTSLGEALEVINANKSNGKFALEGAPQYVSATDRWVIFYWEVK